MISRQRQGREDDWKVLSPGTQKVELTLGEMGRPKGKQAQSERREVCFFVNVKRDMFIRHPNKNV